MAERLDLILFGTDEPPSKTTLLTAGRLTVELRDGNLGKIRFDGVELVRGVAFLARDRDWGTLPAIIENLRVQQADGSFRVTYRARCSQAGGIFVYDAVIAAEERRLTFLVDGRAETDFETNRTGFVVLHPLVGTAGETVQITHTDGRTELVTLPSLIAPSPPVTDMAAIRYTTDKNVFVTVSMTGDAYEMEDQRNWTDASFKTFFRPLAKPYPYVLSAGTLASQSIVVSVEGKLTAGLISKSAGPKVASGLRMPAIGLAMDLSDLENAAQIGDAIRNLAPQDFVVRLDSQSSGLTARLGSMAALARRTDAAIVVEVVVGGRMPESLADLKGAKSALEQAGIVPSAVLVFPRRDLKERPAGSLPAGEAPLADILALARTIFPTGMRIGGGAATYFAELNANPPPSSAIDFVSHGTSAIVHDPDDAAVMETIEALPWVMHSAQARVPERPYWLGPSAIAMRENPYGSGTALNPNDRRIASTRRDPRHRGLFGAAWTLAYWATASAIGVEHLTLAHAGGDLGVGERSGSGVVLHPLFHVLRGAARAWQCPVLPGIDRKDVASISWGLPDGGTEMWVGNLTSQTIEFSLSPSVRCAAVLDASNAQKARSTPEFLDHLIGIQGETSFQLGPYAVARFVS